MVGKMYVKAPVSSNMITTTVTVILITPLMRLGEDGYQSRNRFTDLSAAAAPRKAYVPGVIHGSSGTQDANIPDCGYALHVTDIRRGFLKGLPYLPIHCLHHDTNHSTKCRANGH